MDSLLMSVPWSGLGWGGLIFVTVLALIKGMIIPRSTHIEALRVRDDIINRERDVSDRLMSALRLLAEEHGTTTDKILAALPVEPEEVDRDDEPR